MAAPLRWLVLVLAFAALTCKETDTVYQPVDLLTDPSVPPSVIYTFPGNGTAGPYDGFSSTLTVRFNKFMDIPSLQRAVHFSSPLGDIRSDTCVVTASQGDVASITPVRTNLALPFLWRVGRQYALQIDTTAKDINGNRLTASFGMSFTPEPSFRVRSISPASGAVNVSTNTVQIAFNAPVDSSVRSDIMISPPVTGLWHYVRFSTVSYDSSQIVFQGNSAFLTGLAYLISIGPAAVDKYGDSLTGGFSSSFSTVPFAVTGTTPGDGSTNWSPAQRSFTVSLSDSVDTATIRGAFHISPALDGQFLVSTTLRSFQFIASSNLLSDTIYTATIDTTLHSKAGAQLSQAFSFSFMTGTATSGSGFRVNYSQPPDGDTLVSPLASVSVSFSLPIDTATARSAFSIVPPVGGLLSFHYGNLLVFSPLGSFTVATTYNVQIAASVASTGGLHLPAPYTFSFRTLPFEVMSTYPSDGQTHIGVSLYAIDITLTDTVDTGSVSGAFSISPTVSGTFSATPDRTFYFKPSTELQPYTVYTVSISGALRSSSGVPIAAPYTFSFATGG